MTTTSTEAKAPEHGKRRRVLIVDLNNFATFPTLAIGLLVASLRGAGFEVEVLCPLSHDVPARTREKQETHVDHWLRRVHLTTNPWLLRARDFARKSRTWWLHRPHPRVVAECERALARKPDIVLLSAYLDHYPSVVEIGRCAARHGVPVVLGGPMFNLPETAAAWRSIPGLTAIFGGEVDLLLPALVDATIERGDLTQMPGVTLPDGRCAPVAAPLTELDRLPIPDFRDFPWDRYRMRVVPTMTGRGCGWGKCVFCSDVVSASGRTFRSRSTPVVLHELATLAARHEARHFLFLDLKLNSNLDVWRGLIEGIPSHVPGAEWLGTVHVDRRKDNGLGASDLRAAVAGGMRRISFGFETGSQSLLDEMLKGASVEQYADFIHHAHEAGLSVRCTAFQGFPGETAEDLEQTREFLARHGACIDRIRFNAFSVLTGTPLQASLAKGPTAYPQLTGVAWDAQRARAAYDHRATAARDYRRAKRRLLAEVFAINRRPLRAGAEALDGLM